jgi:hypothetical protein
VDILSEDESAPANSYTDDSCLRRSRGELVLLLVGLPDSSRCNCAGVDPRLSFVLPDDTAPFDAISPNRLPALPAGVCSRKER